MSEETPVESVAAVPVEEVKQDGPKDPMEALHDVLKISMHNNYLARGLRECVKALDKGTAKLCVLASNCKFDEIKNLITALCVKYDVPLIHVEDRAVLGEWCGLCKINSEGQSVKVIGASCAVVKDDALVTDSLNIILEHIKQSS